MSLQKIHTNLWFDHQAEAAARFYTSVFKDSSVDGITYYGSEGEEIHKMQEGTVMLVEFTLQGQKFTALNGGPMFHFNEAVSFVVNCENQQEIDYFWENLGESGDEKAKQCGWLKDRFGVSWQIVPEILSFYLNDADEDKRNRVMRTMLSMKKLDISELKHAYEG